MKKPLFKVGEEVILSSKSDPQYNGDCIIVDCKHALFRDVSTGIIGFGIGYKLSVSSEDWWDESTLRKKYPPSTLSYKELLADLKQIKV